MIILCGGTKGGAGKTTLAGNIASRLSELGYKVMLVDADPQGTSARWVERRENKELNPKELPKIYCEQNVGNIYTAILDKDKLYDTTIVDCGGTDSRELRTGLLAADVFYVPLQASQFDLEQLVPLDEMLESSMDQNPSLKVYAVLARVPANKDAQDLKDAQQLFASFPRFKLTRTVLGNRRVYQDATKVGRGVCECKNAKAKAEIHLLVQEMINDWK